jgi:hypothetical protein
MNPPLERVLSATNGDRNGARVPENRSRIKMLIRGADSPSKYTRSHDVGSNRVTQIRYTVPGPGWSSITFSPPLTNKKLLRSVLPELGPWVFRSKLD